MVLLKEAKANRLTKRATQ